MNKRIKIKLHNAFLTATVITAYVVYIVAVLKLGTDWSGWTSLKVAILAMSYLIFIFSLNEKYLTGDKSSCKEDEYEDR